MEPNYSAPVQAPPTEFPPGYLETDDEDFQETSGQGTDTTAVQGKETDIWNQPVADQGSFFPTGVLPGVTTGRR